MYKSIKKKQFAPYEWMVPLYGKNYQFVKPTDTSPLLDNEGKKRDQAVVDSFLYFTCAIDNTILLALIKLSFIQVNPTETTNKKSKYNWITCTQIKMLKFDSTTQI